MKEMNIESTNQESEEISTLAYTAPVLIEQGDWVVKTALGAGSSV